MKSILLLLLFFFASAVHAQTLGTDTIEWHSTKVINAGNELTLTSKFISYGNQQIDWIQADGEEISSYRVTNVIGNWSNLNEEGEAEFEVMFGTRPGSIFFYRTASGLRIRIDMLRENVSLVPLEFVVSTFNRQTP